mgnify:CR=1 FL=1
MKIGIDLGGSHIGIGIIDIEPNWIGFFSENELTFHKSTRGFPPPFWVFLKM